MSTITLYHDFDMVGYRYKSPSYREGNLISTIENDPHSLRRRPYCQSPQAVRRGTSMRISRPWLLALLRTKAGLHRKTGHLRPKNAVNHRKDYYRGLFLTPATQPTDPTTSAPKSSFLYMTIGLVQRIRLDCQSAESHNLTLFVSLLPFPRLCAPCCLRLQATAQFLRCSNLPIASPPMFHRARNFSITLQTLRPSY